MPIKKGTTRAKNPGQLKLTGGTATKKPAARKNTAVAKSTRRKPAYRRNPTITSGLNLFFASAIGVGFVKLFDLGVRYIVPAAYAGLVSSVGMGAGAIGLHVYGGKIFPQKWADIGAVALGLFGLYRAVSTWVDPHLPAALGGSAGAVSVVGAPVPIQDPQTGQLGYLVRFSNGDYAKAWNQLPVQ